MRIDSTPEFDGWLSELDHKGRAQVDDRLDRICQYEHFGHRRYLGDDLFELKWKSGRRVYFAIVENEDVRTVLVLLGGDKHGQARDIARVRRILEREAP